MLRVFLEPHPAAPELVHLSRAFVSVLPLLLLRSLLFLVLTMVLVLVVVLLVLLLRSFRFDSLLVEHLPPTAFEARLLHPFWFDWACFVDVSPVANPCGGGTPCC